MSGHEEVIGSATATPVLPSSLSSTAYGRVRQDIIRAVLLPGQKLHIGQLCDRYSIGLSPMREALSRLSRDGLVQHTEQRGFRVTPLSEDHLDELCKTRGWLNEIGLRESMASGDPAWQERVLLAYHRMSRIHRSDAANAPVQNPAWEDSHREFHASLVAACGSSWLIGYCEQLYDAAERYRHISRLSGKRNESRSRDEHRDILEAVIANDPDRAVGLLLGHFNNTATLVRSSLRARSIEPASVQKRSRAGAGGANPR
jgi:GntR family carbon starvation induced transcriptional regulator